ncbi:hypothetical protein [Streptomyces uncialis]|uniref:hypothetical protein n=1 Tax=Streptomyces uncialis TaxID=1048205 RepID=UPI0022579125|nr:hypothetical protein [Streptomyces uncialis]MCX4661021.1 hypothetical protein [Streptomyces uncialis]
MRFRIMLAERQLELGHLELACGTWGQVLDEHTGLHSMAVDTFFANIRTRRRS